MLTPGKERLEGLVHFSQDILKHLAMNVLVFFPVLLDLRQLVGLIVVADRLARHAVSVPPFLKCSIVEFSGTVKRPVQAFLLLARWVQSELVGLLRHAFGSQYTA